VDEMALVAVLRKVAWLEPAWILLSRSMCTQQTKVVPTILCSSLRTLCSHLMLPPVRSSPGRTLPPAVFRTSRLS